MKTTAQQPRTSQAVKAKVNKQNSVSSILQRYKDKTTQRQSTEEEEPLKGKFETAQLKTKINHSASNFSYRTGPNSVSTERVGTNMTAFLDPADPVSGSEPGASEQKNLMKRLKGKYNLASWALIKGHLLNHDLGGFGVSDNLFPITKDANSSHLHAVEYGMKDYLTYVSQNRANHVNPNGVYYQVKVQSGLDEDSYKNGSQFICNAYTANDIDGNCTLYEKFIDNVVIESHPGPAIDENGWAHDGDDEDVDNFSHAESPDTWNHKGTGRRGRKGSSDWEKEQYNGRISTN